MAICYLWSTTSIHSRTSVFLIYINDLPPACKNAHVFLFEDDTNISSLGPSFSSTDTDFENFLKTEFRQIN